MLDRRINLFALALILSAKTLQAASVAAADGGIDINLGPAGTAWINYPDILDSKQSVVHPLIEKKVEGKTATLRYDGGPVIHLDIEENGDFTFKLSDLPADAAQLRATVQLPFALLQGGTFQAADGQAKPAPADKPSSPHLFSGNTASITFNAADGSTFALGMPRPYTFAQVTDLREWGQKAYSLLTTTPIDPANPVLKFTTAGTKAPAAAQVQVDAFGQPVKADFPGKVKSLEELKADVEAEKAYYAQLNPPPRDPFGGLPDSGTQLGLQKTGFFHVEQKAGRWLLVDPLGNAFYAMGVCIDSPGDDYTYVKGREGIYAWLPDIGGEFASAFREKDPGVFSFHLANQIRKYGKPFDLNTYQTTMLTRLRKWGFNTVGPFSTQGPAVQKMNFPYVTILPFGPWPGMKEIPGAERTWDPFDSANVAQLRKAFADGLPARANDPLLIGYYLSNEPIFEDVPRAIPRLPGSKSAAKKRLVQMLQEKYATIDAFNTAWGQKAGSFDELIEPGLAVSTPAAAEDMAAFTDLFFETYYKLIHDEYKKFDSHHLLIGNRFQTGTINNEHLLRIGGKYLDVISYNYYTYGIDIDRLKRIHNWCGRPMMLTEWYYDSPKSSGLPGGGKDVSTQAERGLAYRNYVEQSAALPFVVGQTWFTLVDQAYTGRWFSKYNGENGNTGLIAVSDRPWKEMLQHATISNYEIYDVMLGKRPPFAWDDPRFVMNTAGERRVTIMRAVGPVAMDGTAAGFPGVPAEPISGKRLVSGADATGFEASYKLCYDDDNLYVLVDVSDPTPMKSSVSADALWSGDCVELFIGHDKLDAPGQLLFSDRQILLGAAAGGKAFVPHLTDQPSIPVTVTPRVDGKGYVLAANISAAVLGFRPAEGKQIRFDMAIDDSSDGHRRERQLVWNGTDRNSSDRTGWGMAAFGK